MSAALEFDDRTGSARRPASAVVRTLAAMMPALVLSYSALIDPLVNLGLDRGLHFGGVELGAERKTRLAQIFMPFFLLSAVALAVLSSLSVPARLVRVATPGILLVALALVSAAWSQAPGDTLQLAGYQTILFGSLLTFVAVSRDPARIARWVLALFALVVAVNLVAVLTRPPGPIGHQGIYQFKNTLGAAGGCAFLFGLFHVLDRRFAWRWIGRFTVLGALALVLASDSKTALALMLLAPAAAIALYIACRLLRIGPMAAGLLLLTLGGFALLLVAAVLGMSFDDILVAAYGDATFTGRTHIWNFALDHARQTPVIGNGYRAFWSLGLASPKHGSEIEFIRTIGSGHSGFVDIFLDLGLVGLALLLAFVLAAFSAAGQVSLRSAGRTLLYVSVVLFVVGRNAMESVILWSTFFDNLAFVLVAFLAAYRENDGAPAPVRRRFG